MTTDSHEQFCKDNVDDEKNIVEKPDQTNEEVIAKLAALTPLEYDKIRGTEAEKLNVRVKTLDTEVTSKRGDFAETKGVSIVEEISPFDDEVDGDRLLTEIALTLKRYVYLPEGAYVAVSTWCLGTFCMDAWQLWPKLLITSPEKRCGKTTLIETMEALTYRPLVASNISPSAIFRCIEEWCPTLYLDEADTFAKNNPELNGIMNAGHKRRTAKIIRSEKVVDSFQPKAFSVWAAQVIAGIGSQRDTMHDRSIHIEMERKLPDELVKKIPFDFFEKNVQLRMKCLRWAEDNVSALRFLDATIPNYGNDRAQDNWEPLIKLGKVAGGAWEKKVLAAYKLFSATENEYEDAGVLLLRDIKIILDKKGCGKIASASLVEALILIKDSPWFEWKKGTPITQNSLSRLLKPFKIKPSTIRIGTNTSKGYKSEQFEKAFERYVRPIPPIQTVTTTQPSSDKGFSGFQSVTHKEDVTVSKRPKPSPDTGCYCVTLQKEGNGDSLPKSGNYIKTDVETTI